MKQAYVDANVLIRFITDDPPEMAQQAAALFRRVDEARLELVVDSLVVAETVWVLSSFYGFSPGEIAPPMQALLLSDGILSEDKTEVLQALTLYEQRNVDFVDALLALKMRRQGVADLYSFDEHFDRLNGIRRLLPA